jgi:plastocyanin
VRRAGLAILVAAAVCAGAVPAWSGDEERQPPVAELSVSPQAPVAGGGAVLDGSASRDPDGSVASYAWDLDGDGSFERMGGSEARLAHVFEKAGQYSVGLRVVDATGDSGDARQTVEVVAAPEPEPQPEPEAAAEPAPDPKPKIAEEPAAAPDTAAPEKPRPAKRERSAKQDDGAADEVRSAASATVSIRDFSFAPKSVTVNTGDSVTWRNNGDEPHTATGAGFDTGTLTSGQSGSATFRQAGNFSYKCQPHPFMTGTVRVVGSGSGGSGGNGTSGAQNDDGGTGADASDGGTADSGDSLPSTGLALGPVVLTGLLMIGLGVALRRRVVSTGF